MALKSKHFINSIMLLNFRILLNHVWIFSGKFFKYENILTGCESESPGCPAKLELPHFIKTDGIVGYSPRFRK